jgi:hypothetical protein
VRGGRRPRQGGATEAPTPETAPIDPVNGSAETDLTETLPATEPAAVADPAGAKAEDSPSLAPADRDEAVTQLSFAGVDQADEIQITLPLDEESEQAEAAVEISETEPAADAETEPAAAAEPAEAEVTETEPAAAIAAQDSAPQTGASAEPGPDDLQPSMPEVVEVAPDGAPAADATVEAAAAAETAGPDRDPSWMVETDLYAEPSPYEASGSSPADDASVRLRLARIHLRTGSLAMARAELESLAAVERLDVRGQLDLAEARWRTGDVHGAGEAAAAYVSGGGTEPLGFVIAAEGHAIGGRHSEAARYIEEALYRSVSGVEAFFAGIKPRANWGESGPVALAEPVVAAAPGAVFEPHAPATAPAEAVPSNQPPAPSQPADVPAQPQPPLSAAEPEPAIPPAAPDLRADQAIEPTATEPEPAIEPERVIEPEPAIEPERVIEPELVFELAPAEAEAPVEAQSVQPVEPAAELVEPVGSAEATEIAELAAPEPIVPAVQYLEAAESIGLQVAPAESAELAESVESPESAEPSEPVEPAETRQPVESEPFEPPAAEAPVAAELAPAESVPVEPEAAEEAPAPQPLAATPQPWDDEISAGVAALAANDPLMGALHLAMALRVSAAAAGPVLEAIGDRRDLALELVRGEAHRALGQEVAAGLAEASVATAISAAPVARDATADAEPAPAPAAPAPDHAPEPEPEREPEPPRINWGD